MSDPLGARQPSAPQRFLPRAIAGPQPGSFARRALAMPFLPGSWSEAAHWRTRDVVLPLLALFTLLSAALALYRGLGFASEIGTWADKYEASYPAIVVENGAVRVEGGGVIRIDEDRTTLLVDPEETVPLEQIRTPEYIVVRKHEIVRKRLLQTQVTRVADLQQFLGDPFRLDGASLRAFQSRWGPALGLGLSLFLLAFGLARESLAAAAYGAAAAGLAYALRGRRLELSYGQCFRVALGAYSLAAVLDLVLTLLGRSPGLCWGMLMWPGLLTALATWRIGEV